MLVHVQKTPNPNALKFVLPWKVFARPLSVSTPEQATQHPVAQQLLALEPVYNVFMVQDFVTVNKLPNVPWEGLQETVVQIIAQYFELDEFARDE